MDVKYVNPVLDSIVNVLSMMAQMKPEAGKPRIKDGSEALGVVTGMIDFKGSGVAVSTAISFSKPVALEITKRMMHTDPQEVDEMVQDLVGEISNMMAGGAKGTLEGQGYSLDLTLPSVFTGDPHEIKHTVSGPVILLPFTTEAGDFFVELVSAEETAQIQQSG